MNAPCTSDERPSLLGDNYLSDLKIGLSQGCNRISVIVYQAVHLEAKKQSPACSLQQLP